MFRLDWLNCGVDGSGWVAPPVTLDNLIYRDLSDVLQEDGNPFSACSDYLPIFQDMETQTGIPTIFLASISLQESGCNPNVTGGAGEIGMMQITPEKCPQSGNCYDPATNIGIGAQYFQTVINDQCSGNVACGTSLFFLLSYRLLTSTSYGRVQRMGTRTHRRRRKRLLHLRAAQQPRLSRVRLQLVPPGPDSTYQRRHLSQHLLG